MILSLCITILSSIIIGQKNLIYIFQITILLIITTYQSIPMLKYKTTKIYILTYHGIHFLFIFCPVEIYVSKASIIYLPLILLDYVIFLYGLSFFLNKFRC